LEPPFGYIPCGKLILRFAVQIFAGNTKRERRQDYKNSGHKELGYNEFNAGVVLVRIITRQDHYNSQNAECD
jgi:hypothetical protein